MYHKINFQKVDAFLRTRRKSGANIVHAGEQSIREKRGRFSDLNCWA